MSIAGTVLSLLNQPYVDRHRFTIGVRMYRIHFHFHTRINGGVSITGPSIEHRHQSTRNLDYSQIQTHRRHRFIANTDRRHVYIAGIQGWDGRYRSQTSIEGMYRSQEFEDGGHRRLPPIDHRHQSTAGNSRSDISGSIAVAGSPNNIDRLQTWLNRTRIELIDYVIGHRLD